MDANRGPLQSCVVTTKTSKDLMSAMENLQKEETTGMRRAQSSLELLSQTAIEIESANSSPHPVRGPSSPARVTPASSVSETLVLPEMVSTHAGYPTQTNGGKDPPQLMPRPDGLASLTMRAEPSGLCLTTTPFPEHIYPSSSFSSCGGSFQPTEHYHENAWLRQQLAAKDTTIATLTSQVENLTQEIRQLRQLPTGKISQIPLEDMLNIMRVYGSEVSDMAMPPRKNFVQKASVVRQFRRWNPNFLEWFEHVNGRWVPKLGKVGELTRRKHARQECATKRKRGSTLKKKGSSS